MNYFKKGCPKLALLILLTCLDKIVLWLYVYKKSVTLISMYGYKQSIKLFSMDIHTRQSITLLSMALREACEFLKKQYLQITQGVRLKETLTQLRLLENVRVHEPQICKLTNKTLKHRNDIVSAAAKSVIYLRLPYVNIDFTLPI